MHGDKERQRIQALFDDLAQLSADPRARDPFVQQELASLQARIAEIEKQLHNEIAKEDVRIVEERLERVNLYEKDQVGFVFTGDKVKPLDGIEEVPPAPKAITSPLVVGSETIGNMQIGITDEHTLTPEDEDLAQAVAQQVSLQIQNLRLLAATERARTEAETATRQFMHESWESYLDAINRSERIGYVYDQASVSPFLNKVYNYDGIQETVKVMDEQVGTIYVKPDPQKPLTHADKELINEVASQIAQQVENIRLLADAARARAEAEEAVKRLTRANWNKFMESQEDPSQLGFVYDSLNVKPLSEQPLPDNIALTQPLTVRGEAIGQIAIAGKNLAPESAALAASVAAQASIHLETLRLSEELQKRARELEELDRLKSAFLANMSHELRTPLNSILGFTDVMLEGLDGPLTDYMNNDLRLIQKNGQHLLHLINDVLDMAKIESGRMNLHPEKFTVHSVIDEVISITSSLASERNVSLVIEPDSDQDVDIFADNTRLRQVMINLVNNAIKFTSNGKVTMRNTRHGEDKILITVKDTGLGIPPDKLEAIFQEFTQVDTSTTRKAGGTGLGLPISRRLVEMHGGRLWAESTGIEGEGSTFFVELPLVAIIADGIEKKEK